MFGESGAPGMVLVVVRGTTSLVLGHGEAERGKGRQPDGRSLFCLNSVSTVFATEVPASLAAEGRVRLTDTPQRHAGRGPQSGAAGWPEADHPSRPRRLFCRDTARDERCAA